MLYYWVYSYFHLIIWWFSFIEGKGWDNDEHYRHLLHHTGYQHLGKGNVPFGLFPYMGQQHRLVKAMTDASEMTQQTAHSPQIPLHKSCTITEPKCEFFHTLSVMGWPWLFFFLPTAPIIFTNGLSH